MSDLDKFAVEILNGRHIATLATHNQDGHIHLTAVWYLYKDGKLFVATNSNSRKIRNIELHPKAALIVETRKPGFEQGVTARGTAEIIRGNEARPIRYQVHARYLTEKAFRDPQVSGFFESFDDAVICLTPESWSSWDMGQANIQFFNGILSTDTGYLYHLD